MARVAFLVSPHGLGHAARACAVMEAMADRIPGVVFDVVTTAPEWFFRDSLRAVRHELISEVVDVGMVQRDPFVEDVAATVRELDRIAVLGEQRVTHLAELGRARGWRGVLCDVTPLGIAIAERLSVPSVLVESFTWDWIYRGYRNAPAGIERHAQRFAEVYSRADLRVQTEPWCNKIPSATQVPPVARRRRAGRDTVRKSLGVPADAPLVLVTMGGFSWSSGDLAALEDYRSAWFVVPGRGRRLVRRGRCVSLPSFASQYHPDLVAAADVVVAKLGYSTVAEAYFASSNLAYVCRPRFPESPILEGFVRRRMTAVEIGRDELVGGAWPERVVRLSGTLRRPRSLPQGSPEAAAAILATLRL